MQRQSKFKAFAQSAANLERFGAYKEAEQHWRKAEEKAQKEDKDNKKWCRARAEFCKARIKPKAMLREPANEKSHSDY